MNNFTQWLGTYIVPKAEKIVRNPWISAISSAFTIILPFILAGSVISLYNVLIGYLPFNGPNLSLISTYSLGLITLFITFAIPFIVMEKKGKGKYSMVAGMLAVGAFLMLEGGTTNDLTASFGDFGAGGTMVGLVCAICSTIIFDLWLKVGLWKDSEIPDFIVEWVNGLIPTLMVLGVCLIVINNGINISVVLQSILSPLFTFGQSYAGMLVVVMVPCFLYSFGIGTRTTSAFRNPIYYAGIAANVALVAQGLQATDIVTFETIHTCAFVCLGGTGCTFGLVLLMMFKGKSKKMKMLGRVTIGPSLFNINEPVIYGAPIIYNPLLMIPMWINSFVTATITYVVMRFGFLNIPSYVFQAWSLPAPIGAFLATNDFRAILVWAVILVLSTLIWYPFFQAYDQKLIEEEGNEANA